MPEFQASPLAGSAAAICPHLGVREDTQTCLSYPSSWNLCHHVRSAAAVTLEHQRQACLSPGYHACPVYKRERLGRLPARYRAVPRRAAQGRTFFWLLVPLLLLGIIAWVLHGFLP